MDDLLYIEPSWFPDSQSLVFGSGELNSFQRARYQDTFGFFQRTFGLYGYMQLNRRMKYVVHTPKGTPLVWQKWSGCAYDDTGSISMGRRELTPDPVYMREQFCLDELLDSCFQHLIRWDGGGEIMLDQQGMQIFQSLQDELMANAQYGARLSLTSGQLYDVNTIAYSPNNTANITDIFKRTHGSVRGWVKLFLDLAAQGLQPHLNKQLLDPASDFDEFGYTGDVLVLYDNMVKSAPKKLKPLINSGGTVSGQGRRFFPLVVVSDSFMSKIAEQYRIQNAQIAQNRPRISVRTFGNENSPTPQMVYYLDQSPVVPLSEIAGYDEFTNVDTHFFGIIASGNISLGTSFGDLPEDIESRNVGMIISREDNPSSANYGMYTILSHALMKSALVDANYAVASIASTTEA